MGVQYRHKVNMVKLIDRKSIDTEERRSDLDVIERVAQPRPLGLERDRMVRRIGTKGIRRDGIGGMSQMIGGQDDLNAVRDGGIIDLIGKGDLNGGVKRDADSNLV